MSRKTIWTKDEFQYLKENYLTMTDIELANHLDKTITQIKDKRAHEKLGRKDPRPYINWEPIVEEYKLQNDIKLLSQKYNVKIPSLINHLKKAGVYIYENKCWTENEIQYVRDNIGKLSNIDISKVLNVPVRILVNMCKHYSISSNSAIYYYDNYLFDNEKELLIFNKIKERIENNYLIDSISVKNIFGTINPGKYLYDIYGFGYEGYLKTFFNINHKEYVYNHCIEIYKLYINKKIKQPPNDFYNLKILKIIGDYVFNKILKWSEKDFYNNYSVKILKKFRLRNWINEVNLSIYDFVRLIYPTYNNIPYIFKKIPCPNGYWDNKNNRIEAIEYLIKILKNKGEIYSINDITKLTAEHFQKNNLGGLLTNRLINDILNEYLFVKLGREYNEWEFRYVTNGYWKNIDNVKKAIKWMLEDQEHWDSVCLDWLKENYSINLFKKYNLTRMISSLHSNNMYISFNDLLTIAYPNLDIFPWEFNMVTNGYWDIKDNADQALKQLIEFRLKLSISDIPKYISRTYFNYNYPKFMLPLMKFYNGNIFNWINSIYPNKFSCRDFGYIECLDGTIVKSITEQMIHNYLINNYNNVKYLSNEKENEGLYKNTNYIPDWLIKENIVVEYLGLYKENINKNSDKYKIYREKTIEKIKLAEKSNLIFIFVYESDLKSNLAGLKEKLKECA